MVLETELGPSGKSKHSWVSSQLSSPLQYWLFSLEWKWGAGRMASNLDWVFEFVCAQSVSRAV